MTDPEPAAPAGPGERGLGAELVGIAARLAVRAGEMVREGRRAGVNEAATKSSATDVVTEWDRASERLITGALATDRPDDAILGEEGTSSAGATGITWMIDPIDGTTNFLYGLPGYAVSIAACDDRGPLAGAVYLPVLDELFTAVRGDGARRNGQPIAPSGERRLDQALIGTGFNYSPEKRQFQARRVAAMIGQVRDIRRLGAASADCCYAACGLLDAFFEEWLGPWDVAAGQLIATEAGCLVGAIDGGPLRPDSVLVSTPALFEPLRSLVVGSAPHDPPGIM